MPLDPIAPADAVNLYLEHRRDDARQDTHESIEYGLDLFIEWTEHAGIETMDELGGRELLAFKS